MNKTNWTRIVFATILLAFLGGCAAGGTSSGSRDQQEESAFPK